MVQKEKLINLPYILSYYFIIFLDFFFLIRFNLFTIKLDKTQQLRLTDGGKECFCYMRSIKIIHSCIILELC